MIEPDILDKLRSITARTGLSTSEQIRRGIRWWLESREWPLRIGLPEGAGLDDWRPREERVPRRAGRRRGK